MQAWPILITKTDFSADHFVALRPAGMTSNADFDLLQAFQDVVESRDAIEGVNIRNVAIEGKSFVAYIRGRRTRDKRGRPFHAVVGCLATAPLPAAVRDSYLEAAINAAEQAENRAWIEKEGFKTRITNAVELGGQTGSTTAKPHSRMQLIAAISIVTLLAGNVAQIIRASMAKAEIERLSREGGRLNAELAQTKSALDELRSRANGSDAPTNGPRTLPRNN